MYACLLYLGQYAFQYIKQLVQLGGGGRLVNSSHCTSMLHLTLQFSVPWGTETETVARSVPWHKYNINSFRAGNWAIWWQPNGTPCRWLPHTHRRTHSLKLKLVAVWVIHALHGLQPCFTCCRSQKNTKKTNKICVTLGNCIAAFGSLSMTPKKHCPTTHEIEIRRTLTNFVRHVRCCAYEKGAGFWLWQILVVGLASLCKWQLLFNGHCVCRLKYTHRETDTETYTETDTEPNTDYACVC